jgi:hypothetical protein
MDFVEYAERELIRSNVTTGSMTSGYVSEIVLSHAVGRSDDGKLNSTTACELPVQVQGEPREP